MADWAAATAVATADWTHPACEWCLMSRPPPLSNTAPIPSAAGRIRRELTGRSSLAPLTIVLAGGSPKVEAKGGRNVDPMLRPPTGLHRPRRFGRTKFFKLLCDFLHRGPQRRLLSQHPGHDVGDPQS